MDDFADPSLFRISCAYAQPDNFLFKEQIYRTDAPLVLHETLAKIVMLAAEYLTEQHYRMILYDGLRTVEAQEKMLHTQVVKNNPQWLQEPRLLSPPGAGAHPRAMAIDISLETQGGVLLDMGTPFDFLASDPAPAHNPAHRDYPYLADSVRKNRIILDHAMMRAAVALGTPLFLLPQEWWDYRLPQDVYQDYAPLSDSDLSLEMRLMENQDL